MLRKRNESAWPVLNRDNQMAWSGLQVPRSAQGGVISIGNFDGVHRGHQAMLKNVVSHAQRLSLPAVVVTFDPHPVSVLRPDIAIPRLTTLQTRQKLLKTYDVQEVVVLPVNQALLNMDPLQFFKEVITDNLNASGIIEGPDFRFGKNRAGDTKFLQQQCAEHDLHFSVFPAVLDEDGMISSTRIRSLIADGEVKKAVALLGHPHTISGTIGSGAGRGRKLGIPTANLQHVLELLPADGVYAGRCRINDEEYAVAINIGPNPTFADHARKVECHILGFSADIYEQSLSVEVCAEIRKVRTFADSDELMMQVRQDLVECQSIFELWHG